MPAVQERAHEAQPRPGGGKTAPDLRFVKRVAIVIGMFALAYFLWLVADVLLLVFAAILVAILLRALAGQLERWARIPGGWSLAAATALASGVIGGVIYLFGSQLTGQLALLGEQLPDAIDAAGKRVGIDSASQRLEEAITSETGGSVLSRVSRWSYSLMGVIGNVVVVLVAAVYLASDPSVYRRGFAMLFPPDQQERVFNALDATGRVLRHWIAGQFVAMVLVGAVSTAAYFWIGLPSALALGLVAGMLNFIPFLGPVLSAIPPLIFAMAMGQEAVLWTLAAVVAIQQFEGNIATPLIQRRAASIPPAVAVFAIVVFGVAFGIPGVLLAVPLAAAVLVLVRNLWVRETLNGEPAHDPQAERDEAHPPR